MRFQIDEAELAKLSPEEQIQFKKEWERAEKLLEQNPLYGITPHEKQKPFLLSRAKRKLFAGGNQSGKTTGGLLDDVIQALPVEFVPEHLMPYKKHFGPFACRIGGLDLIDTIEGVIHPKLQELIPPAALQGGSWEKAYAKKHRVLHFINGSYFQFMSYDQENWPGATLDRIHFDEEPPQSIYNEARPRLWAKQGDMLITMTPVEGMTWIYDEIYEKRDQSNIFVIEVDVEDNAANLPLDEVLEDLDSYSAEEKAARKSGKFVSFQGLVYDSFEKRKVVQPEWGIDIPEGEIYNGIDPGIRFMCAVLWAHLDEDDMLTVFEERPFTKGETIPTIAREMLKLEAKLDLNPRWRVIDPASRNRDKQTGRSDQMAFADEGIMTIPGQNAVSTGINAVKARLEAGKLQITANCTELIKEFERYQWRKPTKKGEQEEDDRRAKPVKKDDHLLDVLRYICMSRPLRPEPKKDPRTETAVERAAREDLEASTGGSRLPAELVI